MDKQYRVQDLADYNRVVDFPDGKVVFDGHFANVVQKYIQFFARSADFQIIGDGFEIPSAKFAKEEKIEKKEKKKKK